MTSKEIDNLHKIASKIRRKLENNIFELNNIDIEVKDYIEEIILDEINKAIENK